MQHLAESLEIRSKIRLEIRSEIKEGRGDNGLIDAAPRRKIRLEEIKEGRVGNGLIDAAPRRKSAKLSN